MYQVRNRRRRSEWKAEALIIAEITGSITSEEKIELDKLLVASACVRLLSEDYHRVLDHQIDEIQNLRTTMEHIIKLGEASG